MVVEVWITAQKYLQYLQCALAYILTSSLDRHRSIDPSVSALERKND